MLFVKKMSKNIGRHKIFRQPDVQVDKILGLISSFFYKLRKNAFGIFPICSDGFGSRYACINSGAPYFN